MWSRSLHNDERLRESPALPARGWRVREAVRETTTMTHRAVTRPGRPPLLLQMEKEPEDEVCSGGRGIARGSAPPLYTTKTDRTPAAPKRLHRDFVSFATSRLRVTCRRGRF